jgi:hypothetical protein
MTATIDDMTTFNSITDILYDDDFCDCCRKKKLIYALEKYDEFLTQCVGNSELYIQKKEKMLKKNLFSGYRKFCIREVEREKEDLKEATVEQEIIHNLLVLTCGTKANYENNDDIECIEHELWYRKEEYLTILNTKIELEVVKVVESENIPFTEAREYVEGWCIYGIKHEFYKNNHEAFRRLIDEGLVPALGV